LRNEILARSQAYKSIFDGERATAVLDDLARFCHANSTTHVEGDSHGTSQLEGRRQVWLRIQGYRNLVPATDELAIEAEQ
jgi:hypothetical protein